jgi:hypothetical protein
MPRSRNDDLRLSVLLTCVALATSRIGLVAHELYGAHELVGHGGTALALGAHVTEVRLFWFAGGWIHYVFPGASLAALLAIAMGGIAVELACGLGLALAVRGHDFHKRIARGIGAALVVHGSWYLANGAWSGLGDGQLLYRVLGDARYAVAIAAGAITCIAAFVGARGVFGALAGTLSAHRVAGTCIAIAIAAGVHAGLAAGELRIRHDAAYTQVMAPERERIVARELATWTNEQGSAASDAAVAAERAKLEAAHRTFPFAWLLAIGAGACAAIGARRSPLGDPRPLPLAAAGLVAAASIGGVILLSYVT